MASGIAHSTDIPTREQWRAILQTTEGPFVTLLMPLYRGKELPQNPIRFRNLLREAESGLKAMEDGEKTKGMIETIHGLLDDREFWKQQGDGLAVLVAPGLLRAIRLPLAVEERVDVSARFFLLKSLVPLIDESRRRFHVLALSQNAVRLLEATQGSVRELPIQRAPHSLKEALRYDDVQKQDHFYPGSQGLQAGGISPMPGHGLGVGDAKRRPKEEIARYCEQVDAGLRNVLTEPGVPLVLAGVEYVTAIFRENSTHPQIADQAIHGNPELLDQEDLRARAWEILKPSFERSKLEAADQFGQLTGSRRASNRLEEVVIAAHEGRVEALFADPRAEVYGAFDSKTMKVEIHSERQPEDEEIVNLAVVQNILHGGVSFLLEPNGAPLEPGCGPLAAVLRY